MSSRSESPTSVAYTSAISGNEEKRTPPPRARKLVHESTSRAKTPPFRHSHTTPRRKPSPVSSTCSYSTIDSFENSVEPVRRPPARPDRFKANSRDQTSQQLTEEKKLFLKRVSKGLCGVTIPEPFQITTTIDMQNQACTTLTESCLSRKQHSQRSMLLSSEREVYESRLVKKTIPETPRIKNPGPNPEGKVSVTFLESCLSQKGPEMRSNFLASQNEAWTARGGIDTRAITPRIKNPGPRIKGEVSLTFFESCLSQKGPDVRSEFLAAQNKAWAARGGVNTRPVTPRIKNPGPRIKGEVSMTFLESCLSSKGPEMRSDFLTAQNEAWSARGGTETTPISPRVISHSTPARFTLEPVLTVSEARRVEAEKQKDIFNARSKSTQPDNAPAVANVLSASGRLRRQTIIGTQGTATEERVAQEEKIFAKSGRMFGRADADCFDAGRRIALSKQLEEENAAWHRRQGTHKPRGTSMDWVARPKAQQQEPWLSGLGKYHKEDFFENEGSVDKEEST